MNPALFLLIKLRLKGWARRLTRNVQTVRGAVLTSIFGVMLLLWLGSVIFSTAMASATPASAATSRYFDRFAPLALMVYCLSIVATSGSTSTFVFSPAEVQFLFSGPFTRRQLLAYKILVQFLLTLPVALFMSLALRTMAGSYLTGLIAILLTLVFMQMFGLTVNLVSCAVGEMLYSRARRLVVLGIILVLSLAAWAAVRNSGSIGMMEILGHLERSTVFQFASAPFRWYVRVMAARGFDASFFRYGASGFGAGFGSAGSRLHPGCQIHRAGRGEFRTALCPIAAVAQRRVRGHGGSAGRQAAIFFGPLAKSGRRRADRLAANPGGDAQPARARDSDFRHPVELHRARDRIGFQLGPREPSTALHAGEHDVVHVHAAQPDLGVRFPRRH